MARKGKTGRRLQDHALWEKVRQTVKPLHGEPLIQARDEIFHEMLTQPNRHSAFKPHLQQGSKPSGSLDSNPPPSGNGAGPLSNRPSSRQLQELQQRGMSGTAMTTGQGAKPTGHSLLLDESTRRKIKKGKTAIDASIDLHGMTQVEAHGRLLRFIHNAYAVHNRVVLVITGKGPEGQGTLKRAVPHWLEETPMRQMVSGYSEANQSHGGAGALYVRIRRNRDKRQATS